MNNKDNRLGMKLRTKRLEKGLTQKQIAKELKLSHTYISDIEVGRTVPPISTLQRIQQILEDGTFQK